MKQDMIMKLKAVNMEVVNIEYDQIVPICKYVVRCAHDLQITEYECFTVFMAHPMEKALAWRREPGVPVNIDFIHDATYNIAFDTNNMCSVVCRSCAHRGPPLSMPGLSAAQVQ